MNITSKIRTIGLSAGAAILMLAGSYQAFPQDAPSDNSRQAFAEMEAAFGFVPSFIKAYPESGVPGLWAQLRDLQLSPDTALSQKEKELIALAVASQIPCAYCTYAHTRFAALQGATEQQIQEAVAVASLVRQSSTVINGSGQDEAEYRMEIDRLVDHAQQMMETTSTD